MGLLSRLCDLALKVNYLVEPHLMEIELTFDMLKSDGVKLEFLVLFEDVPLVFRLVHPDDRRVFRHLLVLLHKVVYLLLLCGVLG